MKMITKFFVAFGMLWLIGIVFFCIIPPLVIPVCAFFWPMWVLPLWIVAALIFAIVTLTWQAFNWKDDIRVGDEEYKLETTLPMGVVTVRNLGILPLEEIKKRLRDGTAIEHVHVSGDWIEGYKLTVYYDDLDEWRKGKVIAEQYRKSCKK